MSTLIYAVFLILAVTLVWADVSGLVSALRTIRLGQETGDVNTVSLSMWSMLLFCGRVITVSMALLFVAVSLVHGLVARGA